MQTRSLISPPIGSSDWALVFDTETTTDASQQLRFGVYQVHKSGELREEGVFYDPLSLTDHEMATLRSYADDRGLEVLTVAEFVEEIFFLYAYELKGLCVGFNLPFDLSRIAIGHNSARGSMRGGFSLKLSENRYRPPVQVKHLSNRSALVRFAVPARRRASKCMHKRGQKVPPRRGHFVDVRTLAGALLSGSWSLGRLAEHLEVEHEKLETEGHGETLTEEYLEYAAQDVQATWECFERLRDQYERYELTDTPLDKIYSEASLGKAYLKQMGVKPWKDLQPDFPPELLGSIMSSYYGGRSEVRIRREPVQVLYCDFLSMYPTVCTLMSLWRFVVAEGVRWFDATEEVRRFLDNVSLEDLQKPETWTRLRTLVRVKPEADVFPVRGRYGEEGQYTIGLNHLTSEEPLWYTLADCVASKLLTGKAPDVVEALRFEPAGVQPELGPIDLAGNPDYRIDPARDDFYKRLIDLRSEVKSKQKASRRAGEDEKAARLGAEQLALKLCANATSYGIFVELNVAEQDKPQEVTCHGGDGAGFPARVRNVEKPGKYFHPLLATLITGAARLMLAMAERLATDSEIGWAFCDTDSMALARPEGMKQAEFVGRAKRVSGWFTPLNPYEHKGPLFKLEDANHGVKDGEQTDQLEPLYCLAVSAKRYALFNLDTHGRPVVRKASAHGLGHLLAPYADEQAPRDIPTPAVSLGEIGVERWQYDLWHRVVEAALSDTPEQVRIDDLSGFQGPAVSRYAASTPNLLRWFDRYNHGKPYRDQVKPFNFLLSYQPGFNAPGGKAPPKPVSAYDKDLTKAAAGCFDRQTGDVVPQEFLKTYEEALAQYHLHPEAKFHNGKFVDSGPTSRRHVLATAPEYIGKEANRWEEQFHLGLDAAAQTQYGTSPHGRDRSFQALVQAGKRFGQRKLAEAAGVSLSEVSAVLLGKREPKPATLAKLHRALSHLEREASEDGEHVREVLDVVRRRCRLVGVREFARRAGVDGANLAKIVSGRRRPSQVMLVRLQVALASGLAAIRAPE
jgi:predicted transcriptional regulator